MRSFRLFSSVAVLCSLLAAGATVADQESLTDAESDFFENQVRPILAEHCLDCHSSTSDEPEAGLRLDSREGVRTGGDSGPAVVAGDADASLLIEAIRYHNTDLQMPPDGRLADSEMDALVRWVEMGAPDPRVVSPSADGADSRASFDLLQRRDSHWCWQPIQNPPIPMVRDADWPLKPLDYFILSRLEQADLTPSPPADRPTLLRRVTFDLTGLPPTPDELAEFLNDASDNAYTRVVDRLLDSPHYGEHWGQHWLDLVRFAETRGHEQDFPIPEAYRFRDYVITAFNANVRYDQFLMEHIAGDLIEPPRLHPIDRSNQSIQGTGFWHLHEQTHSPVDIRGDEADRVHNQIDVFSRAFLGLSVGCARCHDHKFDAISAQDYYGLYGFLQSSSYRLTDVSDPIAQRELANELCALNDQFAPELTALHLAWRRSQSAALPKYLAAAASLLQDGRPLDATAPSARPRERPNDGSAKSDASDEEGRVDTEKESEPPDGNAAKKGDVEPASFVQELARDQEIDTRRVWRLANHLRDVVDKDRVTDPLYRFARMAQAENVDAKSLTQIDRDARAAIEDLRKKNRERRSKQTVVTSIKEGEQNYRTVVRRWTPDDIVEDFQFVGSPRGRWITDGYRFGIGPQSPQTPMLTDNGDQPIRWLLDTRAAQTLSNRFPGFLRTRTFEVVGDRLWYRTRGNGQAFLAVDSHRVVAGPLHGVVKKRIKSDTTEWRWHSHNVRDYIGHRVHVEFTPSDEFAVDQVVFSEEQPSIERTAIAAPVHDDGDPATRDDTAPPDLASAAAATASRLVRAIEGTPPDAALLNWLILHGDLLPPSFSDKAAFDVVANEYVSARRAIEDRLPTPIMALALLDGDAEDEPVHIRGNHRNLSSDIVPRGVLSAFRRHTLDAESTDFAVSPAESTDFQATPGSGRLELARALVRRDNPLVARVFVNRVWHHLFGRGIVETVDDFGVMGKAPTHPDLLDHLAHQFADNGWSVKELIRNVLLSQTYRVSSSASPLSDQNDPANRWFSHMSVRRLPAESIRDSLLAVSGRLDPQMYGKSTMVHITPYMRGNRSPQGTGPLDGDGRRSIYTEIRRNHLSAFLAAFDKPVPFMAIGKRTISNSPSQSLILLNDPFVHEQATIWAEQLLELADNDDRRLSAAYLQAFARLPTEIEKNATLMFVAQQRALYESAKESKSVSNASLRAWTDLCHTLFNVKEFVHIN